MSFLKRFFSKKEDIISVYLRLAEKEQWDQALPLIEEIVARNENISTSWFNYGVCLEGLGRHEEALGAFKTSYELEPQDKGIQYRIFRSLAIKGDPKEFTDFAEIEVKETPEILELLQEHDEFQEMTNSSLYISRMK